MTLAIRGCGPQLPGTHRVQEFLITQGEIDELYMQRENGLNGGLAHLAELELEQ